MAYARLTDDVFSALTTPAARLDPYPVYAAYRRERPMVETGLGVTFLFGYRDCHTLLRDRRASVDERNSSAFGETVNTPDYPTLIHTDPPDHDRLRRLVQAAFTPKRIETLRQRTQAIVGEMIDRLHTRSEADLIADIAYPVPLTIISELLGLSPGDHAQIREWSIWLARSIDPGALRPEHVNVEIERAQREFVEHIGGLIAARRRSPGDDLLSQLVIAESDGDRLNEGELIGMALLLLVAGHETTVNLIGNGMLALLKAPTDEPDAVLTDPAAVRRLVDEMLRFDSPVQMTSRIALEPIALEYGTLNTGEIAVLYLGSANHDPATFSDADRFDPLAQRSAQHLAFGQGIHHCLGAALARVEAEITVPALMRNFPAMRLLHEPEVRPGFVLRGREALVVSLR